MLAAVPVCPSGLPPPQLTFPLLPPFFPFLQSITPQQAFPTNFSTSKPGLAGLNSPLKVHPRRNVHACRPLRVRSAGGAAIQGPPQVHRRHLRRSGLYPKVIFRYEQQNKRRVPHGGGGGELDLVGLHWLLSRHHPRRRPRGLDGKLGFFQRVGCWHGRALAVCEGASGLCDNRLSEGVGGRHGMLRGIRRPRLKAPFIGTAAWSPPWALAPPPPHYIASGLATRATPPSQSSGW